MTERETMDLILRIAERGIRECDGFTPMSKLNLTLDIENFHRLQPVDLQMLAEADAETLQHDVIGIWNHYDRTADAITGCFVARTAASNHQPSHWGGDDERAEARQMGVTSL